MWKNVAVSRPQPWFWDPLSKSQKTLAGAHALDESPVTYVHFKLTNSENLKVRPLDTRYDHKNTVQNTHHYIGKKNPERFTK